MSRIRRACAAASALTFPFIAARADAADAGQSVTITAPAPARPTALTEVPAEASSPQSLLGADTLARVATPISDFGTLANLTPSFVSTAPNGNGFDAAKGMTLRGFADGQFNVTLDGIPFQDPDSFGHHTTSYLPLAALEQLHVDRSPGGATDLGYATMGGTLQIESARLRARPALRGYASGGSHATGVVGATLDGGRPTADGGSAVLLNAEHLQSDGALSHAPGTRDDLLLKSETRLGGSTLTLLYDADRYRFQNPPSVTTAQIAAYGLGFGFTDQPGTPTYAGYATTHRHSDFAYLRSESAAGRAGRWSQTVYTYAYASIGLGLKGDGTASPVGNGYGVPATDIAGRWSNDRYRTWGDIVRGERALGPGTLRGGLWIEQARQQYTRLAIDLSSGSWYAINRQAGSPVLFDFVGRLDTVEPYVEYEWTPTASLALRVGLREQQVRRGFDAAVVPNALPGTGGNRTRRVTSSLPSIDLRWTIDARTHAFLQGSTGALVPSQSFFYTASPAAGNRARPETARALQIGITRSAGDASLTLDAYRIELRDYFSTVGSGGNTQYVNDGRVGYRGIEVEGHAALAPGWSLVGNGSLMRARFEDSGMAAATQHAGDTIPYAPTHVALLGLLYEQGRWDGSLLTKFVGAEYQGRNGSADGPDYLAPAYTHTDLTLTRRLDAFLGWQRPRLTLQITNLGDRHPVTDQAGPSAAGPLLVNVLAGRSWMLSFSAER
ncbi:MAG: TonB-dependent receptor [Burkholderiales bacterium]|nr:TonB-dependent receptor [Burkholderiales bacterium]MDE1928614.1 TonB-dependent receptor [Burkholderiales bacterium]MDE2158838.1 TonB-dependent receptor [Burkholderiales bacterium]MDE2503670.1 TonB-dependent receptor [Burkholderiales bacterium]